MSALKSFLAGLCIFTVFTSALLTETWQAQAAARASILESTAAAGVEITDPYRGGFAAGNTLILPVTIKNTGTTEDQYTVEIAQWVTNHTGWTADVVDSNEQVVSQTGVLALNASQTLQIKFKRSPTAATGDYCTLNVKVTSQHDGTVTAVAVRQAAVSAPFVQMIADFNPGTGRQIQVTNANLKFARQIGPQNTLFNGLMTTVVSPYHYIHSWIYSTGTHANIEYEVMDVRSGQPSSVVQLTDNLDPIFDHSVAMAAAPNRVTGAVFIRTDSDVNGQNLNVYLGRINASGLPMGQPLQITDNNQYGASNDPLVPFFTWASIRATTDNRFIITWLEQKNSTQNVFEAIYDTNGARQSGPVNLTNLTSPSDCAASSLADGATGAQAVLTYMPTCGITSTLQAKILDQNGGVTNVTFNPAVVVNGSRIATARFSNNNVLVAWVDDATFTPKYAVWNTSGTVITPPTDLTLTPSDGLDANYIAVTYDVYSRGIITWGNTSFNRFYYALVDGNNGQLITPPMVQRVAALGFDFNPGTFTTALLEDPFKWETHFPMVRK